MLLCGACSKPDAEACRAVAAASAQVSQLLDQLAAGSGTLAALADAQFKLDHIPADGHDLQAHLIEAKLAIGHVRDHDEPDLQTRILDARASLATLAVDCR
jgi:hypothetical protein